MPSPSVTPIAVIGAGIVGAAIAFELQRRLCAGGNPQPVFLIDRDRPGMGASFGNMASIAVTEFLPASRPAIWKQLPKWLLDPEGPMRLRLGYAPRMFPWFLRFLAASRPARVAALGEAGANLCRRALADTQTLLAHANLSSMLSQRGCLCLFEKDQDVAGNADHFALLDRFGFSYDSLSPQDLTDLEPALTSRLAKVIRFADNRTVSNPHQLVLALTEQFQKIGGSLIHGNVGSFERTEGRISAITLTDGRRFPLSHAVLCAGVQTRALARALNEAIPLETERGYHTQIMDPGITLSHSLIWPARAFVVSPTAGGIRVGGTVELAGLDAEPDYRRAQVLVRHAREILPNLQSRDTSEWMGHRPALPDTIPIISPSAKTLGVYYATGHGHLGLTNAATTAALISDMILDQPPSLDLTPYRIDRF